ncbi:acyl-CoA thioesterase [Sulfitobacter aestuariivivens]|uniref:Acyl-CoA thioesterase n=1 Tax=Sulfitobacter aestuariivivens TaxID=2766981 RepID=A0A927D5H1_9RHOB|nr:thioesterase family protein [Sulfitobacter aestuariivivens]MBD3665329.1 acyl-CoA thioesterase [Sulfitobacter aestuariivivens]
MSHHVPQKVLFKHCDPAGIVFYPRYFEMINDAMEDWFAGPLGAPWEVFHKTNACPSVEINVTFMAVSRHGDQLDLRVQVEKLGRSSVTVLVDAYCGDQQRFAARVTLVCIRSDTTRPEPWPDEIRTQMERFSG